MPPTVLLADSDRIGTSVLAQALRDAGFSALVAHDAPGALALAPGCDLVCLDVGLPGGGGFTACAPLRERMRGPILLMTERIDDATCAAIAACGAEDTMFKPVDPFELIDKVAWWLEAQG